VVATDGVSRPIPRIGLATGDYKELSESEAALHFATTISASGTFAWEESRKDRTGGIQVQISGTGFPYFRLDSNPQIKEWELGSGVNGFA
jgi:hypothetical protein